MQHGQMTYQTYNAQRLSQIERAVKHTSDAAVVNSEKHTFRNDWALGYIGNNTGVAVLTFRL
jgi:hypothetical protein